ncbi:alpha/beta-Hydrolases superfamily protein [Citrus sinensis]|nr:alpha/beta-Hydrolases superfamily protein [Citrus sinensis]
MAFSATFSISSSSSFTLSRKIYRPFLSQNVHSLKPTSLKASSSTSVDYSTASVVEKQSTPSKVRSFCLQTGNWQWKFKENSINIYYEKHERESPDPSKNILMIPTISDVSTVEEWRLVAQDIVQRVGKVNWRATIVDWPGLGYSDRPKMDYNADVMEKFVVDLINAPDSPGFCYHEFHVLNIVKELWLLIIFYIKPESDLVIFGGGHAATLTVRAAKKNLVKPTAIAAVAPTWAGPLPIVFGRDSSMETRYGLLRGTLRAPGVGWMMYNMLVSNEKAIQSQYKSHVYANPDNVTPGIVESRYTLTKRKGARYVPAAFLTGLLDPVNSREEFLQLFADLEGKLPLLVVSTEGSPRRSKAEMEALKGAKGVTKFVEVPGALLPQEEYPAMVAQELYQFLQQTFEPSD